MRTAPPLSVIVCTYAREAALRGTLESILAQQFAPGFELVVVDQSPDHERETREQLNRLRRERRIVYIHTPVANLPRARNIGIRQSLAPIILFLDDDVLLPPGFLECHHHRLANDETLAGLTGRIVFPGENPNSAPALPIPAHEARERIDMQVMRFATPIRGVLHIVGANMSFRREWLLKVGGFSHAFRGNALAEDLDLAGRIRRVGGRIEYDPVAWLTHLAAPTGGCRAEIPNPFSRSRARMKNYYYALFHGLGFTSALSRVVRRWQKIPRLHTAIQAPEHTSPRSKWRSALGRAAGAMQGFGLYIREHTGGDIGRVPRRRFAIPPAALSVVIPTLDRHDDLRRAILSLEVPSGVEFELIVIDQSREELSAATRREVETHLIDHIPNAHFVYHRIERRNASHARNVGARMARHKIILFVDDDVAAPPGLIAAHLKHYAEPDLAAVGGRIAWPGQDVHRAFPFPGSAHDARTRVDAPVCYHTTPFMNPLHVITCNMSVRKSWLLAIGGFNERLTGYGEDIEFNGRLLRANGRILYDPDAVLIHHSSAVGGTRIALDRPFSFGRKRGWAWHYSTLRVCGIPGWTRQLWRRLGSGVRRFQAAKRTGESPAPPSRGPVSEIRAHSRFPRVAALCYKARQMAGSASAFPSAVYTYIRDRNRAGSAYSHHRVLMVVGALDPGGIQRLVIDACEVLLGRGIQPEICEMSTHHGSWADEARDRSIRVRCCPVGLFYLLRFGWILWHGQYDAIHVHRSSPISAFPLAVAWLLRVPVRVAHFHNVPSGGVAGRARLYPLLRRVVVYTSTAVIGVSRAVLGEQFPGWATDSKSVFLAMPNFVPLARGDSLTREEERARLGLEADDVVIGHVGRFSPAKNHAMILEMALRLMPEFPRLRFLCVGDGPLRASFAEDVAAAGVKAHFLLPGHAENPQDYYPAMDIFFFPSHWEGFPLALLEAMRASVPCLTSNLETLEGLLDDGARARSFSPGDADGAEAALRGFIRDPDLRGEMGAAGRRRVVEKFPADRIVGQWIDLYDGRFRA